MSDKKIKILSVCSDQQGIGHFRNIWPAQSLQKHFGDDFDVEINPQPNVENMNYLKQFDIIHFHRHLGPPELMEKTFAELKAAGVTLIMDIDDFWEPPSSHPLYQIVKEEKLGEKIIAVIKASDYVTTTTEIFASYIREYNPNVIVIPNAIDMNHPMWKGELNENKGNKCRISWIGGSCYDNKTEILTENGFKFFKDLIKDEKVACLNPKTNELEFNKPLGYVKEKYTGKLQCVVNSLIDYAVSPNHNMYVSIAENLPTKKTNFSLIPSENVFNKNVHFKKDAIWNGIESEYMILPKPHFEELDFNDVNNIFENSESKIINSDSENLILVEYLGKSGFVKDSVTLKNKKINLAKSVKGNYYLKTLKKFEKYETEKVLNMDLWLKFFGFWVAEGWTSQTPGLFQVGIAQKKDNGYLKEIFNVLEKLGYNPTYTKDTFQVRVFDKQLWQYLSQFGKAEEKYIPKEILNLSSRQLKIFLEWYLKGDGSKENGGKIFDKRLDINGKERGVVSYNSQRQRGYTVSKILADNIQEICLKIGVISTITNRGLRNSIMKDGRKVNAKHDAYVISIGADSIRSRKTPLLRAENQFESDYDDYIYCVNVPDNIIYVRRNGKTMWCGNSHLQDLKLLEPSMTMLYNNTSLENKFQMIMCGFDTRGSITEIKPDGSRTTRAILPQETVWLKFEEIFNNKYSDVKKDAEYFKWLSKIKREDYPEQYEKSYVRRWTLPLTQYGKHYDYCDVCLAPIDSIDVHKTDKGQIIKKLNLFNEVKSELKIIEAGMKKKCLIAQDFGIYKKILKNGETGILVSDNKDGWYKAMRKVIQEPEYREMLANNLYEYVKERYELKIVTAHRADVYKKILETKNKNTTALNQIEFEQVK